MDPDAHRGLADLADLAAPDVPAGGLVLVPVGSLEQHGPHLPLDTDTVIAVAVADALARSLGDTTLVAPPVAFGSSGEHQSFPGTVSIGTEALRTLLVELARSLATWAGRVVFVNGHGGNLTALDAAVDQLVVEGHRVSWVPCAIERGSGLEADLHAGLTETSLMLLLRPQSVRLELAEPGDTRPLREILPAMATGGVAAVSANGVLGDPTGATAHHGLAVLDAMVRGARARLDAR